MSNPPPHTTEDSRELPPRWECKINPQGIPYFVNHETRTTTWTSPLDSSTDSSDPSNNPTIPLSTAEDSSIQLPPHIERKVNAQGRVYYANHRTRTTTWYNPMNPPVRQDSLPLRYERALDSQGRIYYKDHELHVNTWLNPLKVEEMRTQENKIVHEVTASGLDYWVDYASGRLLTENPAETRGICESTG